jgi:hypothetical protein
MNKTNKQPPQLVGLTDLVAQESESWKNKTMRDFLCTANLLKIPYFCFSVA